MERCLLERTQNPNESFHQKILKYCPKVENLSKTILDFGIACTLDYNVGYLVGHLGSEYGIPKSENIVKLLKNKDNARERGITEKPAKMRKILADPKYAPGMH